MDGTTKKIDFVVSLSAPAAELENAVRQLCRSLIDSWSPFSNDDIALKQFDGGITNKLYRCTVPMDKSEHHVLVRIYGNKTELLIDRNRELQTLSVLYKTGLGPQVYGVFTNGYIYQYYEGKTLSPDDLASCKYNEKVAKRLGEWHSQVVRSLDCSPTLWTTINHWITLVPSHYEDAEKDKQFKALIDINKVKAELAFLEEQLGKLDAKVVFCHNDLLCGNFIVDDEKDVLNIIDYEYASHNFQPFDIANHFCEWAGFDLNFENYPKKDQQYQFYKAYLSTLNGGREATPQELHELYVQVNMYSLASHMFWGTWALVQAKISDIDFDFLKYGMQRYQLYYENKAAMLSFVNLDKP